MPSAGAQASDIDAGAGGGGTKASIPEGCPLTPPTSCPSTAPHYADIRPIVAERCVTCHDGQHGQWSLADYQSLADWFGEVQGEMMHCTMPPLDSGLQMPLEERMTILTWIRCGFPK